MPKSSFKKKADLTATTYPLYIELSEDVHTLLSNYIEDQYEQQLAAKEAAIKELQARESKTHADVAKVKYRKQINLLRNERVKRLKKKEVVEKALINFISE